MDISDKLHEFLEYQFELLIKEENSFLEKRKEKESQRKDLERTEEYKKADYNRRKG